MNPENLGIEVQSILGCFVQLRILQHVLLSARSLKYSKCQGRHRCEHHIIKPYTPSFKEDLSRKAVDKGKPDLDDVEHDVLVEAVQDTLGDSIVIPGTVNHQQILQIFELSDG